MERFGVESLVFFNGEGTLFTPTGRYPFSELREKALHNPQYQYLKPEQPVFMHSEASAAFVEKILACFAKKAVPCILPPHLSLKTAQQQWPEPQLPGAALVLFTSGSSGAPKGVLLSKAGIQANIQAVMAGMNLLPSAHTSATLVILPLHHAFALITQVLLTLHSGGDLHLLPSGSLAGEIMNYFTDHHITHTAGVPSQWNALLHLHQLNSVPEDYTKSSLKHIQIAGAALDKASAQALQSHYPQAEIWIGYGLTEAGPRVSAYRYSAEAKQEGLPAGFALPGVTLRIESTTNTEGKAVALLGVKSPACMLGYWGDAKATRSVLQDGWLRTGDCARLEQGMLWIQGRADDIFQSGGEKISPLEIEQALLLHPEVHAAAVWPESDPLLGHRIVAGVVSKKALSRQSLLSHLRPLLPKSKHPRQWVRLQNLPMNGNGKLQRNLLAQWPSDRI